MATRLAGRHTFVSLMSGSSLHPISFNGACPALSGVPASVHEQIAAERARALDLRERLAALRATVAQQRRAMGGVNAARDGDLQARPHDRNLRRDRRACRRVSGWGTDCALDRLTPSCRL